MRMLTLVLAVLALSAFIGCQSKPMVGSGVQSDREGIQVHGDWVIEVRNPDGSLETRSYPKRSKGPLVAGSRLDPFIPKYIKTH